MAYISKQSQSHLVGCHMKQRISQTEPHPLAWLGESAAVEDIINGKVTLFDTFEYIDLV